MKNLFYILIFCCFSIISLQAQSKYEMGMQKGMDLVEAKEYQAAVALFERIGQAEKDNWIPIYHATNTLINLTFGIEDITERTAQLEKAKEMIAEAHSRAPENSEIYTLEGRLYLSYLNMSPMVYGMTHPAKITALHEKALALNPDNPRAHSNKIQFEMGTARFFGKDTSIYCDAIQEVLLKFDNQQTEIAFAPTHGIREAQSVANNCE